MRSRAAFAWDLICLVHNLQAARILHLDIKVGASVIAMRRDFVWFQEDRAVSDQRPCLP